MIKKTFKILIIVAVISLVTSLTIQLTRGPLLVGHAALLVKRTQVQVGEQVDYTVYITTNWFEKPSTKLKITPETDNVQVIATKSSISSYGFSSITRVVKYSTVPVDDNFKIKSVEVSAKVKALFTNEEKSISIDLKPIQVIALKEDESAKIQTETLIDKNLVAIDKKTQKPTIIITIVVAFILLIIFMVIKWLRQRRNAEVIIPPWTIALTDLKELEDKFPMSFETFYVTSTDILRQYIEVLYKLPATESTTPEFIKTLGNDQLLMPETKNMLTDFLKQADMIKFAKQASSEEQMHGALKSIRQLINDTTAKHLEQEEANA